LTFVETLPGSYDRGGVMPTSIPFYGIEYGKSLLQFCRPSIPQDAG